MTANFIFYTLVLVFFAASFQLWRRRHRLQSPVRAYLLLLLPAFAWVPLGMYFGTKNKPAYQIKLHGWKLRLDKAGDAFTVGSDHQFDHLQLTYRHEGREMFTPGLLKVTPLDNSWLITQTDPRSVNVVKVNGRPLRSLPLQEGVEHRVTFGAFQYDDGEDKSLYVAVVDGTPRFRYQDLLFEDGFSREVAWGWFSFPYPEGRERHLAYNNRIRFPGLRQTPIELLGQASVVCIRGTWYLNANNADIRMDGAPFPNSIQAEHGARIRVATLQIGEGYAETGFLLGPLERDGRTLFLESTEKRFLSLPDESDADRICLTGSDSLYSDTFDVVDPRFPYPGIIINREGGSAFVFRGEVMEFGKLYSAGPGVFSIDHHGPADMLKAAWLCLVFLATLIFLPPSVLRRTPAVGIVMAGIAFLLALRQVLAFRAWMGPPFKESTFLDSVQAPLILMLFIVPLLSRESIWHYPRAGFVRLHNFFRPGLRRIVPKTGKETDGTTFLFMIIYALLLHGLFPQFTGVTTLALIGLSLLIAAVGGRLSWLESRLNFYIAAAVKGGERKPVVLLVPLIIGLILAAPIFGGKEVIALLPGRPRPDIFIQVFLLFLVSYFAAVWLRAGTRSMPRFTAALGTFVLIVILPLLQGSLSRDMGFFVTVGPPLLFLLIAATWNVDKRLRALVLVASIAVFLLPLALRHPAVSLEQTSLQRLAFFVDQERVRAEHFFVYLAHLPILWVSSQGFLGAGLFRGDWYWAIGETSVNDNVASVFIQGELGGLGTILIFGLFLATCLPLFAGVLRPDRKPSGFKPWMVVGIALMILWTAGGMFAANLGWFPLTGKNLPLLGLDSLNDCVRYGLLFGIALRYWEGEAV